MRHVVLMIVLLTGCAGQIEPGGDNGTIAPDAGAGGGGGGGGGGGTDAGVDAPPAFACRNTVANVGSGNHHPGEDCQGACHNHGFTLGGTIFSAPNSATPVVGATVTAVDAAGKAVDIVSQRNGNFYTSQAITFPVTVTASACPNVAPMITKVTATMDGCNKGGCHVAGAQGVIHLP
jgi:hypothetical protein